MVMLRSSGPLPGLPVRQAMQGVANSSARLSNHNYLKSSQLALAGLLPCVLLVWLL